MMRFMPNKQLLIDAVVGSNSATGHFIETTQMINPWASSGTDGVSESSILGLTDSEHQVFWREPDIEPKINVQDASLGEGDVPDLLKSPLEVPPETRSEPGTNASGECVEFQSALCSEY